MCMLLSSSRYATRRLPTALIVAHKPLQTDRNKKTIPSRAISDGARWGRIDRLSLCRNCPTRMIKTMSYEAQAENRGGRPGFNLQSRSEVVFLRDLFICLQHA